jgi:hypothetical protein
MSFIMSLATAGRWTGRSKASIGFQTITYRPWKDWRGSTGRWPHSLFSNAKLRIYRLKWQKYCLFELLEGSRPRYGLFLSVAGLFLDCDLTF